MAGCEAAKPDILFPLNTHGFTDIEQIIHYITYVLVNKGIVEFKGAMLKDKEVEIISFQMNLNQFSRFIFVKVQSLVNQCCCMMTGFH